MRVRLILWLLVCWPGFAASAQMLVAAPSQWAAPARDSAAHAQARHMRRAAALRIAVPAALLGVGVLAHSPTYNQTLYRAKQALQAETQETFSGFDAHGIDDYSRHLPLAVAYGLLATGHRGERTAVGFTLIYLVAHELDQAVVSNLKRLTAEARPNNAADFSSFPSSHTSQAFLTATLLHEQYGRQYPWLSVSGYAVAAATGTMRVLGNKHWATDVLAGAAIGFLSAETTWHLYPALTRLLPGRTAQRLLLVPTYVPGGGAGLVLAFQPR